MENKKEWLSVIFELKNRVTEVQTTSVCVLIESGGDSLLSDVFSAHSARGQTVLESN